MTTRCQRMISSGSLRRLPDILGGRFIFFYSSLIYKSYINFCIYDLTIFLIFDNYSDLTNLAREAAFGPIREIGGQTGYDIRNVPLDQIRPISKGDFENALTKVRTSVDKDILNRYEKWNVQYGDVS